MRVRVTVCSAVLLLLALWNSVAPADEIYSTGFEEDAFSPGPVKNQDGWQGAPLPYISTSEPHSGLQSVQMDGRDLLRFTPDSLVFTVSWQAFSLEDPVVDVCVDARLDGPSTDVGNGPADDRVSANLGIAADDGGFSAVVIISSAESVWAAGNSNNWPADTYRFETPASLGEYHNLAVRLDSEADLSEFFLNGVSLGTLPLDGAVPRSAEIGLFAAGDGSVDLTQYTAYFDNFHITPDGCVPSPRMPQLKAGDADQDFDFDQLDIVQVQIGGKYLTGQTATWGEGDWDGAPGGERGNPPAGNGVFDQLDIIAALAAGIYLTGPYFETTQAGAGDTQAALVEIAKEVNEQISIVYHAGTGELAVDAPVGVELSSINIDSAAGIFSRESALNLGGRYDNDTDNNVFKATFGGSFGSLSFGKVAQAGLSQSFVINDLSVVGSLAGGGELVDVNVIYHTVPEPTAWALFGPGALVISLAIRLNVSHLTS